MEREEKKQREAEQSELFAILDRRCKYEETTFDDIMDAINDIMEAGYHKIIPKGSVLIDKTELETLRNDLINAVECNLNHVTLQLEEESKKTAREILQEIWDKSTSLDEDNNGDLTVIEWDGLSRKDFDEIAEKYGVEVE